jgi:hypothetical protein
MTRNRVWTEVLACRPDFAELQERTGYLPVEALELYLAIHRDNQPTQAEVAATVKKKKRRPSRA